MHIRNLRSEADYGSLQSFVCTAGASFLPAMAFFGATATKDSLYDYTVKDAGGSRASLLSPFMSMFASSVSSLLPALIST